MRAKMLLVAILSAILISCSGVRISTPAHMAENDWNHLTKCVKTADPEIYQCPREALEKAYDCMVNCYYDHKNCEAELEHCQQLCELELLECKGDLSQCKTVRNVSIGAAIVELVLLVLLVVL